MVKIEEKTMLQAVNESVECAIADGTIDRKKHAGPIKALQTLAAKVDADPYSSDNVTLPTMLKFFEKLQLVPLEVEKPAVKTEVPNLVKFKRTKSA